LSNIIQFPGSKLPSKLVFDEKFDDKLRDLPPKLSECLKGMYKTVSEVYATDLPSFELHISGLNNMQTEQIETAVVQLMGDYEERAVSMLRRIMELETEICMLKCDRAE